MEQYTLRSVNMHFMNPILPILILQRAWVREGVLMQLSALTLERERMFSRDFIQYSMLAAS